jgi:erythromycin esterase
MLIGAPPRVIAASLACAFACQRAPAVAPPPPSGTLTGTVLEASGAALAGPVLVGLTDTKTSWQIAIVETDPRGRFAAQLPPGDYALAITSPRAFGFVEHVKAPGADAVAKLSRECLPVQGRLSGAAAPSRVAFNRYSQFTGDRFVAPASPGGGFQVCLPEADYVVSTEGASVSQAQVVHVPVSALLELPVWPRSTIEAMPQVPGRAGPADLASFVKALARGPRVLGLGEANHGTGDFYTRRGELALALAREGELRYVLLEADAIGMLAIDDYVQGREIAIAEAVAKLRFWITDIQEFHQFLNDVREYNKGVSPDRRVHVMGIDAQRSDPPAAFLLSGRAELALPAADAELLERLAADKGALSKLAPSEVTVLEKLLDRLEASPGGGDLSEVRARAAIAARSLRHQLGYVGKTNTNSLRDAAMADLTMRILELGGPGQATVWAHQAHVAREPDNGSESLGQHLARRIPGYYAIAFLSYDGEARAWDPAGEIGVIPHKLGPAPPYNMESVILAAAGSPDIAWVRLDTVSESLKAWLRAPRFVRELGSVVPRSTQVLRPFPQAFDAVVVIKRASASTPTSTGERRARP